MLMSGERNVREQLQLREISSCELESRLARAVKTEILWSQLRSFGCALRD